MLRLKTHLLSALCATSSLSASSLVRGRLLSAAPRSAVRFVPDDYLVARCGLTPEQAWEASKHLTSLKSPSNPDAVRNFLGRLGLSDSAASTAIARHPQILCSKVDETLARRVAELRKIGISPGEISHLVTVYPKIILSRIQVSRLAFYFSLMGSCERRVRALLENNTDLLEQSLGEVVKPNLAFLRKTFKCDVHGMARTVHLAPRLLTAPQERLMAVVARGEECSGPGYHKLTYALMADQSLLQEKLVPKVELLKSFGFSNDWLAGSLPFFLGFLLKRSEKLLQRTADFLFKEAADFLAKESGSEVDAESLSWNMFLHSTDKKLVPRFNILKILMKDGLLDETIARERFNDIMWMDMADFEKIFVGPYEDSIPAIADAIAPVRARRDPCYSKEGGIRIEESHEWGLTKIPAKRIVL